MKISRILFLCVFVLEACIDPLPVKILKDRDRLVVDGEITNASGPYRVRVFHASDLDQTLAYPSYEKGAGVWISDNLGNSEKLLEVSDGIYQTQTTQGVVNREYYLKIITANGKSYESTHQRLKEAGSVEDIKFDFARKGLPGRKQGELIDALKILIDSKGSAQDENLLRWRWSTIYTALSFPQFRRINTPSGSVPDPPECSGYISNGQGISRVGKCTCCICWSYDYSISSYISDNTIEKNVDVKGMPIGKIPATAMQFYDKYYIEVEQLNLSAEIYDFWNLIKQQQQATSSIFQPNAVKIKGNIHSITNPDEEVLGVFSVSGIAKKNIYISAEEIPLPLPPIDTLPQDCRTVFLHSTTEKPFFW